MAGIKGEVKVVRHAGVDTGVADHLAGGVDQIRDVQLVDLLMEINKRLGRRQKGVVPLGHGEGAGVDGLAVEFQPVIEHSQHTVHHADVIAVVLQNGALLDVGLKHILVFLRAQTVLLVALEAGGLQRLTEGLGGIQNGLGVHHILIFELAADVLRQVVITDDAGAHHGGRIERTLLIRPDHGGQRVLVGNIMLVHRLQHFHGAHNAQNAVIVAAVLDAVAVGCHNDALCIRVAAGERGVHIAHIVHFNERTDGLHAAAPFIARLDRLRREGIPGDAAVAGVTEFGEGLDLIFHSGFTTGIHNISSLKTE